MSYYKIIDKYRPNTLAVVAGRDPEHAIMRFRKLSKDYSEVIAVIAVGWNIYGQSNKRN